MSCSRYVHVFNNLEVLRSPYEWDFCETSLSRRRDHRSLIPFQCIPLLQRMGSGAENSKLLIFLVISPRPGAHPESSH